MTTCRFEKRLLPFLYCELDKAENREMERHLATCPGCRSMLDELRFADNLLKGRKRPQAPPRLLRQYKSELRKQFFPEPIGGKWLNAAKELFSDLVLSSGWGYRVARAAAFLIVGIVIGRQFFVPPGTEMAVTSQAQAVPVVTSADLQQLNDYFVQSELFLLSVVNVPDEQYMSDEELSFNREIAQRLLMKSAAMQKRANALDEESIVVFLNHLEFVLLEVSNSKDEQVRAAFREIRELVKEADLVQKTRELQTQLSQALAPVV